MDKKQSAEITKYSLEELKRIGYPTEGEFAQSFETFAATIGFIFALSHGRPKDMTNPDQSYAKLLTTFLITLMNGYLQIPQKTAANSREHEIAWRVADMISDSCDIDLESRKGAMAAFYTLQVNPLTMDAEQSAAYLKEAGIDLHKLILGITTNTLWGDKEESAKPHQTDPFCGKA